MPEPPGSPGTAERLRALEGEVEALTAELDARSAERDRYRTLVEGLPEPVCRFLPDGRLTFVNRAYAAFFGRTVEECRGLDLFELVPEDEHGILRAHFASFTPEGPTGHHEHRVLTPGGDVRWVR